MTVVVNSFEKYQYAPIGSPRLRVMARVVFLGAALGLQNRGGLHASLLNGVNTSSKWLKKFGFTHHALQEGI